MAPRVSSVKETLAWKKRWDWDVWCVCVLVSERDWFAFFPSTLCDGHWQHYLLWNAAAPCEAWGLHLFVFVCVCVILWVSFNNRKLFACVLQSIKELCSSYLWTYLCVCRHIIVCGGAVCVCVLPTTVYFHNMFSMHYTFLLTFYEFVSLSVLVCHACSPPVCVSYCVITRCACRELR